MGISHLSGLCRRRAVRRSGEARALPAGMSRNAPYRAPTRRFARIPRRRAPHGNPRISRDEEAMARRLRLAVIGTGYGESHIAAFQALSGAEVVAVASAREERAQEVGERHGVALCTGDWAEALAVEDLDAVSIATPPALHREIAL